MRTERAARRILMGATPERASDMIEIEEEVLTSLPIERVFAYVAEFAHIAAWDPGIRSSEKVHGGELALGDRYEIVASFMGVPVPMTYEVLLLAAPERVVLKGDAPTATAVDDIGFDRLESGGTRIRWRAELSFKGWRAVNEPIAAPFFARLGRHAMRGLREELARQEAAG